MFYTFSDVVRLCRAFRGLPCEVSEELRGWSWGSPPLLYPYSSPLSVSDIAGGFCDSGRFVYLKYVAREKERENKRLALGKAVHFIASEASRTAKSLILGGATDLRDFKSEFLSYGMSVLERVRTQFKGLEGIDAAFDILWSRAMDTFSSELAKAQSRSPYLSPDGLAALAVPFIMEFPIDGSLVGLSRTLRVDMLIYPNVIAEVKTRGWRPDYELGVVGYALAFESQYEIPVNYGLIVLARLDLERRDLKVYERVVRLGDGLRQAFIDKRDSYAKVVEDSIDPGKARRCSFDCPYLHVCREG